MLNTLIRELVPWSSVRHLRKQSKSCTADLSYIICVFFSPIGTFRALGSGHLKKDSRRVEIGNSVKNRNFFSLEKVCLDLPWNSQNCLVVNKNSSHGVIFSLPSVKDCAGLDYASLLSTVVFMQWEGHPSITWGQKDIWLVARTWIKNETEAEATFGAGAKSCFMFQAVDSLLRGMALSLW